MTPQEVFDKTVEFLFEQGRPALEEWTENDQICLYRGPDGTKCAVGLWMPDDAWHASINGITLDDLIRENDLHEMPKTRRQKLVKWIKDFVIPNRMLLTDLQAAHDFPCNRKADGTFHKGHLRAALKEIAADYELKWRFK
jgi:hypothetical protein